MHRVRTRSIIYCYAYQRPSSDFSSPLSHTLFHIVGVLWTIIMMLMEDNRLPKSDKTTIKKKSQNDSHAAERWRHQQQVALTPHFPCCSSAGPAEGSCSMRLVWKSLDKMRCLRKRSTIPFLGFLITFLLFLNLYIEDGYVLVRTRTAAFYSCECQRDTKKTLTWRVGM